MRVSLLVGIAVTVAARPAIGEPAPAVDPPAPGVGDAPAVADAPPVADDGLGGSGTIRGDGPPGYVAFTFDDGPHEATTPSILATLAAHDVPATFFVVGKQLRTEPRRALLARIRAAGHTVGNHTWGHKALTALSAKARDAELARADAAIVETLGATPTMVRPPYGASSPRLRAALAARGLSIVLWNLDPHDWATPDPRRVRRQAVHDILARGGGIIVLHDTKRGTALALPGILADLDAASCARLAHGQPPIIPVSLHYFVKDGEQPRAIPPEVEARTQRYRAALEARCAPPAPREPTAVAEPTVQTAVDNHTHTH